MDKELVVDIGPGHGHSGEVSVECHEFRECHKWREWREGRE